MTTPDADPAASALDGIRAVEQAATPGPWEVHTSATIGINLASDETDWPLAQAWMRLEDAQFAAVARISIPCLLAAVEAALKLHQPGRVTILGALCKRHENHRYFSITRTEADGVRACPDCTATVYASCTNCGPQVSVDACPTRRAITAALAGTQLSEDENYVRPA